jgi:hypothetical protein
MKPLKEKAKDQKRALEPLMILTIIIMPGN